MLDMKWIVAVGLCLNCVFIDGSEKLLGVSVYEPSPDDISYFLWTRDFGKDNPQEVVLDTQGLIDAGFKPDRPSILLSHGFTSDGIGHAHMYVDSYLEAGDYNVFSIDWGILAAWTNYFGAASNTRFVADHAVGLVVLLANNGGVQNLHLVGHSLGAHVVGFIGKKYQELGYGKLPRITGLDPAHPAFELALSSGRIDKEDADLVQIIHTNSGMLWEGCLSIPKQIGHMDFYPAGGEHQPGCTDICLGDICTENDLNDLIRLGCSHSRANEYFAESVLGLPGGQGQQFVGWKCASWQEFELGNCCHTEKAIMGEYLDKKNEGIYFMMTREEGPFAMGDDGTFC